MPESIDPNIASLIDFVAPEDEEPEPEVTGECFHCAADILDGNLYDELYHNEEYVQLCSPACYDAYYRDHSMCEACGYSYHREDMRYSERHDSYYCYECYGPEEDDDPHSPTTEDDPAAEESALRIPSLKERPTRLTSCEIEVGRGGTFLAQAYHTAGLSEYNHMLGYHSGAEDSFVRVEEDGSVAAEIIFSKMRLQQRGHANMLERGVGILKKAIVSGDSKLDMRCGLHVHVNLGRDDELEIPCYSMESVENLYHLWNYLEDPIFRLASANWNGHRSQHGNDYAPNIPKGLMARAAIGQTMERGRGSLNLSNYLASRALCRCGAFAFGDWSECTCRLGRSTVEFRVFNTTANTRKLRAYIALCQALVSYAERHPVRPSEFPVMEWNCSHSFDVEMARERLEFMLNELTFTNDERQDLLYCAEKSSLKAVLDTGTLKVKWAEFENQV